MEPVRGFNEIVCQTIDETLEEALGPKPLEAVYVHLKYKFGINREELPYRIDTLCSVLEFAFGIKEARALQRKMRRKFTKESSYRSATKKD